MGSKLPCRLVSFMKAMDYIYAELLHMIVWSIFFSFRFRSIWSFKAVLLVLWLLIHRTARHRKDGADYRDEMEDSTGKKIPAPDRHPCYYCKKDGAKRKHRKQMSNGQVISWGGKCIFECILWAITITSWKYMVTAVVPRSSERCSCPGRIEMVCSVT